MGPTVEAARRAVVVMAKRPAPGATKTRLAPAMTLELASQLYERFLLDTLASIDQRTDCTLVIAIEAESSADYFASISPDTPQVLQVGSTLGERLDTVMTACLDRGFDHVFAIGSDSPDLPPAHLDAAFDALGDKAVDVVLGPTEDGGYYLIGWKQRWRSVVVDVEMSTPRVLDDTLAAADAAGASVRLAPSWYDVDAPEDLDRLRDSLASQPPSHTSEFLASL